MGSVLSIPLISLKNIFFQNNSIYNFKKLCVFISIASIGLSYVYYKGNQRIEPLETYNRVIFITGCDSGIGYSFARHAIDLKFTVIGSFLNIKSRGAIQLKEYCGEHLIPLEIDFRNDQSINDAGEILQKYFEENNSKVFHALINNAGIMVFGEYDWQTLHLIDDQIKINIIGTFHLTHMCLPLLRKYKGRIITVTSHCANVSLPGLGVYGATKAALSAWSDGLRLELHKYGIKVIKFVPGSFVIQSNILNRLSHDREEMENNLTLEKKLFYKNYIDRYYNYLAQIPVPKTITHINHSHLYKQFEHALYSKYPKSLYKIEPFHYKFNHWLFKIAPSVTIRDYLIIRFVKLPKWETD